MKCKLDWSRGDIAKCIQTMLVIPIPWLKRLVARSYVWHEHFIFVSVFLVFFSLFNGQRVFGLCFVVVAHKKFNQINVPSVLLNDKRMNSSNTTHQLEWETNNLIYWITSHWHNNIQRYIHTHTSCSIGQATSISSRINKNHMCRMF